MGIERHLLVSLGAFDAVILPFEGDAPVIDRDQAAVGDRHPMGVAREVAQHFGGACERAFGIWHGASTVACIGAKDSAMSRVEVLPGPERRRRWSAEQKRSIVAEAFAPGASVCEVARRRDVVAGQVYRWRNELRRAAAGFAEVVVAQEPRERPRTDVPALEIEFGRDIRVRIAATAPTVLATAVIKALAAR